MALLETTVIDNTGTYCGCDGTVIVHDDCTFTCTDRGSTVLTERSTH